MVVTATAMKLEPLSELVRELNLTLDRMSALIGRPAMVGSVGEFIASTVFDIALHRNATMKGSDGVFTEHSPLRGRSVNVKWSLKDAGLLDLVNEPTFDDYLVLAGPLTPAVSSKGTTRPWVIASVYLFDAHEITSALVANNVKVGIASSVRKHFWEAAMIYPQANNARLRITDVQRSLLSLFAPR